MKIGIDIDDTLTSLSEPYFARMQKWCLEKDQIKIENENILSECIYDNIADYNVFWKDFVDKGYLENNCKEGAVEVIDKLIEEGHEIHIITARSNNYYKNLIQYTDKWLKNHNVNYTSIHYNADSKKDVIEKLELDIMIDDNCEVMNNVIELGKKGIIMNTFFNSSYNKCKRAYTWYDVYHYVKNYKM